MLGKDLGLIMPRRRRHHRDQSRDHDGRLPLLHRSMSRRGKMQRCSPWRKRLLSSLLQVNLRRLAPKLISSNGHSLRYSIIRPLSLNLARQTSLLERLNPIWSVARTIGSGRLHSSINRRTCLRLRPNSRIRREQERVPVLAKRRNAIAISRALQLQLWESQ